MRKLLTILMAFCFGITSVFAQTKQISGKVTDEGGAPIPGVSVLVKGTTIGTVTNPDGNFSLAVPGNDVLSFSFIGMKTVEVQITDNNFYNVTMQYNVIGVDEVIPKKD